jgi:hypothetical protein
MDADSFAAFRSLFETIDRALPRRQEDQSDKARRLFRALAEAGGSVAALGPPTVWETRIDELGTWTEDPWEGPSYGVDASTTRPLEYNNGLVIDAAYAKTAVAGGGLREIERTGQVTTVAYLNDAETTLRDASQQQGDVAADLLTFPLEAEPARRITQSVATVAQRHSESRQAQRSLDAIDGPLFLDGAVLPFSLLFWVLRAEAGKDSPAETWDVPEEIVRTYVDVIDRQVERGLPVLGVVKTSTMAQVLTALDRKITANGLDADDRSWSLPWVHDHQFMSEVLRSGDRARLTYTSWFVSHGLEVAGTVEEALGPVADALEHGAPEDYRRAFFYVRLPRTGDLLRVETPLLVVSDAERRRTVRLKALKEIAQRRGVPRAIHRADRLARIGRDGRDKIRRLIEGAEPSYDHNRDGRWSGQMEEEG